MAFTLGHHRQDAELHLHPLQHPCVLNLQELLFGGNEEKEKKKKKKGTKLLP